ncbi:hypothetical protein BHE74_00009698, partial [Ensete ventricosum]
FTRRFAEGIGKLAGNMLGDCRKKIEKLTVRMSKAVGLTGSSSVKVSAGNSWGGRLADHLFIVISIKLALTSYEISGLSPSINVPTSCCWTRDEIWGVIAGTSMIVALIPDNKTHKISLSDEVPNPGWHRRSKN